MVPDRRGELRRGLRGRREGVASFWPHSGLVYARTGLEWLHCGAAVAPPERWNLREDGAK